MEINNNSIAALALVTLVLVGIAGLLTMGAVKPPGLNAVPSDSTEAREAFVPPQIRERTSGLQSGEDVGPLVVEIAEGTRAPGAALTCGLYFKVSKQFVGQRVQFEELPQGECQIQLDGAFRPFAPVGPGQRIRCWIKSGDTQCAGAGEEGTPASITVESDVAATLSINGSVIGDLPVVRHPVAAKKPLELTLDVPASHHRIKWTLVLENGEFQSLFFPVARTVPGASAAAQKAPVAEGAAQP